MAFGSVPQRAGTFVEQPLGRRRRDRETHASRSFRSGSSQQITPPCATESGCPSASLHPPRLCVEQLQSSSPSPALHPEQVGVFQEEVVGRPTNRLEAEPLIRIRIALAGAAIAEKQYRSWIRLVREEQVAVQRMVDAARQRRWPLMMSG